MRSIFAGPPRGAVRFLTRLPIYLYRARLGWLLGDRFLMLTHIGRKSGMPRRTVLEVVSHDKATGRYTVAAAWGEGSDWFKNVQNTPRVVVRVDGRRFRGVARRLSLQEAERVMHYYARRHPIAFRILVSQIAGLDPAGTSRDAARMAHVLPFVGITPRREWTIDDEGREAK